LIATTRVPGATPTMALAVVGRADAGAVDAGDDVEVGMVEVDAAVEHRDARRRALADEAGRGTGGAADAGLDGLADLGLDRAERVDGPVGKDLGDLRVGAQRAELRAGQIGRESAQHVLIAVGDVEAERADTLIDLGGDPVRGVSEDDDLVCPCRRRKGQSKERRHQCDAGHASAFGVVQARLTRRAFFSAPVHVLRRDAPG
jgi:hypothetical protein